MSNAIAYRHFADCDRRLDKTWLVNRLLLGVALVALVAALSPVARAADSHLAPNAKFKQILNGIRDSRLQVRRGVCRGAGIEVLDSADGHDLSGKVSWLRAFDHLTNRLRADRQDPVVQTDPATGQVLAKYTGFQYARGTNETIYVDFIGGVKPASAVFVTTRDFQPPENGAIIDWRTFGLMGWGSIKRGVSLDMALARLGKIEVAEINNLENGKRQVRLAPDPLIRYDMVIDLNRGYTVDSFQMWQRQSENGETPSTEEIVASGTFQWIQKEGQWLPISISLRRGKNSIERYDAKITWDSVNQDVPKDLFNPSSFNVASNAVLLDTRLGDKFVPIGRVSDKNGFFVEFRGKCLRGW